MVATLAPARFARIVAALAAQLTGHAAHAQWLLKISGLEAVRVVDPTAGRLTLRLGASAVTVQSGEFAAFEVVTGDGVVIGETRGAEAACSLALERVLETRG